MGGAIIILVAMFVVGPIGVFAVGAILSAANSWLFSPDRGYAVGQRLTSYY